MLNVYDIILNLSDSMRIYESFEWDNKDDIEHIKKIPMIRVDTDTLFDMANSTFVVTKDFLENIYNKSELYNSYSKKIEYLSLFTDTYRVIAVEFDDTGKSLFKSYLLLDEEDEVLDLSNDLKVTNLKYNIISINKSDSFLTRCELLKKRYLLNEIKSSYKNKNYEKINYIYEEINNYSNKSIEEKYDELINDINSNYSSKYESIYDILNYKNKTTN